MYGLGLGAECKELGIRVKVHGLKSLSEEKLLNTPRFGFRD